MISHTVHDVFESIVKYIWIYLYDSLCTMSRVLWRSIAVIEPPSAWTAIISLVQAYAIIYYHMHTFNSHTHHLMVLLVLLLQWTLSIGPIHVSKESLRMESVMVVGRRTCQCVTHHLNDMEHVFNCDVSPVMYKHAYGSMYILPHVLHVKQ